MPIDALQLAKLIECQAASLGLWVRGRCASPDDVVQDAFCRLAVAEPPSLIRTVQTHAFYPAEFGDDWTWRWMGPHASWTVVNSSARALLASVDLETNPIHESRRLTIVLDGTEVQDVVIDPHRAIRRIGPLTLRPGEHTLMFRAASAPTVADDLIHNGDSRPLSVAFGDWRWSVDGGQR